MAKVFQSLTMMKTLLEGQEHIFLTQLDNSVFLCYLHLMDRFQFQGCIQERHIDSIRQSYHLVQFSKKSKYNLILEKLKELVYSSNFYDMVNPKNFDLHRMYQRMETFPQSHKLFRAPSFLQKIQEYLDCSS